MRLLLFFFVFVFLFKQAFSQVTISVTVNSTFVNTSCDDGTVFGVPLGVEPALSFQVDSQTKYFYDQGDCPGFNRTAPNQQYLEVFTCENALPTSLQMCMEVYEEDGTCGVSAACLEQLCQTYAVPTPGNSATYTLSIANDGSNGSWGDVNFTIAVTGSFLPNYDLVCDAVDLGTLIDGGTLGDNTLSNFQNFCATNAGDPNPSWTNDQAIWFKFTTGSSISSQVNIDAVSDPQNIGDDIDLQLAIYESSNGLCSGSLTLIQDDYQGLGLSNDELLSIYCLKPNTTYFILVDGEATATVNPGGQSGFFGIKIENTGFEIVGDQICDATDLGTVPSSGSVGTSTLSQTNACGSNTNDPSPFGNSNQGVWYEFVAPLTGNVVIDVNSDALGDPIDLQLAVYETDDDLCSGNLTLLGSADGLGFDVDLTLGCLNPGQKYWVFIDGSSTDFSGVFDVTITDDGTPQLVATSTDTRTECGSFTWIDGNTYTTDNNTATHTLANAAVNGCDSIITLNLTILQPAFGTDTRTECGSYEWIDGNTYTTDNNTATHTLVNGAANGCDSTITLDLTIIPIALGTDIQTACTSFNWIDGNTYTSSNNTATYTLVNGAVNGCDSIVSLNLTIIQPSIYTDSRTVCDSLVWIDGNTYYSSNNSVSYTYTAGSINGCDSIVNLDLIVNSISDLTTSVNGLTITANNSNAVYQWLDCDNSFSVLNGETGQSYTATSNGNYAIQLMENGCSDTTGCISITNVSIVNNSLDNKAILFPNPTNNGFTIDLGRSLQDIQVFIQSIDGRVVFQDSYSQTQKIELSLEHQERGIYSVTIISNQEKAVYRVVKE